MMKKKIRSKKNWPKATVSEQQGSVVKASIVAHAEKKRRKTRKIVQNIINTSYSILNIRETLLILVVFSNNKLDIAQTVFSLSSVSSRTRQSFFRIVSFSFIEFSISPSRSMASLNTES